jgi:hypothetical protein
MVQKNFIKDYLQTPAKNEIGIAKFQTSWATLHTHKCLFTWVDFSHAWNMVWEALLLHADSEPRYAYFGFPYFPPFHESKKVSSMFGCISVLPWCKVCMFGCVHGDGCSDLFWHCELTYYLVYLTTLAENCNHFVYNHWNIEFYIMRVVWNNKLKLGVKLISEPSNICDKFVKW